MTSEEVRGFKVALQYVQIVGRALAHLPQHLEVPKWDWSPDWASPNVAFTCQYDNGYCYPPAELERVTVSDLLTANRHLESVMRRWIREERIGEFSPDEHPSKR